MINNLTHYKLFLLNNDYYKILYNIELVLLIVPKIILVNNSDYKWMCNWIFLKGKMKLGHGKFGSLLQPYSDLS
jgi:hypothetical protein